MSSLTVTVTGTDAANLVCNFFPPLELYGEWYVGLLDFTSYNSIPNVTEGKNNAFPVKISKDQWSVIKLPTGTYEISDIETYLQKQLGERTISLRPNNNTLKCEIYCKHVIDFSHTPNTIASMLGFKENQQLEAYKTHESNVPVDIIKVNTVHVRSNIVQGAYKDGQDQHTLHSFYPTVAPGFKIVETPTNVIYLPVNVQRVDNIILSLVDQDGDLVDFRGEVITIRLHLKIWDCISDKRHL